MTGTFARARASYGRGLQRTAASKVKVYPTAEYWSTSGTSALRPPSSTVPSRWIGSCGLFARSKWRRMAGAPRRQPHRHRRHRTSPFFRRRVPADATVAAAVRVTVHRARAVRTAAKAASSRRVVAPARHWPRWATLDPPALTRRSGRVRQWTPTPNTRCPSWRGTPTHPANRGLVAARNRLFHQTSPNVYPSQPGRVTSPRRTGRSQRPAVRANHRSRICPVSRPRPLEEAMRGGTAREPGTVQARVRLVPVPRASRTKCTELV